MSADVDFGFRAAVSQLAGAAAYWTNLVKIHNLAEPGGVMPHPWAESVVSNLVFGDSRAATTVEEWCRSEADDWWASPLGRLVARHIPPPDWDATVTTGQAASLLDVGSSRVNCFIQEGRIHRYERGKLSRADIGKLLNELEDKR